MHLSLMHDKMIYHIMLHKDEKNSDSVDSED